MFQSYDSDPWMTGTLASCNFKTAEPTGCFNWSFQCTPVIHGCGLAESITRHP
ncbi:hypothetical protein PGT21_010317 [Puccinia graminis f. sp. tritici]|uniref:Uncharacterized protein n=1 Tax=Puccinia graminis f. sp. tritici TaxID=56615 RepID=A0A5B0Q2J5_PUCGR|nr:hypothetical protein PGT21_010317 [Puccinia graminis f. sp. tritici]KAA1124910.1 hypothetical protein PGTUg99_036628 [Puccinia graminis f. sp. tritici]